MRTEAEIRREVETRLRRRGLLILNGGLWLAVVLGLIEYSQYRSLYLGITGSNLLVLFLFGWAALVGLHLLRVLYIEAREYLVHRAIEREHQFYLLQDAYEKRKWDATSLRLSAEDGELVDFPLMEDEAKQRVKRS